MILKLIRFFLYKFLYNNPGNHNCVFCKLYDHNNKKCNIVLFVRGEIKNLNLKKVPNWNPYKKCVFYPEMIDKITCFDVDIEKANIAKDMQLNPSEYETYNKKRAKKTK